MVLFRGVQGGLGQCHTENETLKRKTKSPTGTMLGPVERPLLLQGPPSGTPSVPADKQTFAARIEPGLCSKRRNHARVVSKGEGSRVEKWNQVARCLVLAHPKPHGAGKRVHVLESTSDRLSASALFSKSQPKKMDEENMPSDVQTVATHCSTLQYCATVHSTDFQHPSLQRMAELVQRNVFAASCSFALRRRSSDLLVDALPERLLVRNALRDFDFYCC